MNLSNRLRNSLVVLAVVASLLLQFIQSGLTEEAPTIAGYPIDPEIYSIYVKEGFLPLRPEMSDMEIARKLKLELPELAAVQSAVDKNDVRALEHALAEYMSTRIKPVTVAPNGKKASNAAIADRWLADEYDYIGIKFKLGERMNWYSVIRPNSTGGNNDPGFAAVSVWSGTLSQAYEETGDSRYADAMLTFFRSFYHNARPLARMEWETSDGLQPVPWSGGGSNRLWPYSLPAVYRAIGNYSGTTDADRAMFLKTFWEHSDYIYHAMEKRIKFWPPNHEMHAMQGLMNMCVTFPDFIERNDWVKRIAERYTDHMREMVLGDGGTVERSGYNFAYIPSFLVNYPRLRELGAEFAPEFLRGLNKGTDHVVWVLAPTLEFPIFGDGNLGPMSSILERASEVFPDRADVAYLLSGGSKGKAPRGLTRVFWQTGWLNMRSDWSKEALFLALNFNGTPVGRPGHEHISLHEHQDLLSFNIWAYGWPFMTNTGTPNRYDTPEDLNWLRHTRSSNSVVVDGKSQGWHNNGGRLESWASLPDDRGPGFTYTSAVSDDYMLNNVGVTHRRAIFFARPAPGTGDGYWLVYDVLTGDGRPHEYSWQGHFQPIELSIHPVTKAVATSPKEGRRFWLVPAQPETLTVQQKMGPMQTRNTYPPNPPYGADRAMCPYISFIKWTLKEPTAFAVLLCPEDAKTKPPTIESLTVEEDGRLLSPAEAIACRIVTGSRDDIVAMTPYPNLRHYGTQDNDIATDAEAAYVRRDGDMILEAGLTNGTVLDYRGKNLLRVSPDITSIHVRYADGDVELSASGTGEISVYGGSGKKLILNGKVVEAKNRKGEFHLAIGSQEKLAIGEPDVSASPEDLRMAIGLRESPLNTDAAVVRWNTPAPSDAVVEYQKQGSVAWTRTVNPEFMTEHSMVMSRLIHGKTYQVRVTSRTPDGKVGRTEIVYRHNSPILQAMEEKANAALVAKFNFSGSGEVLPDASGKGNDGLISGARYVKDRNTPVLVFNGVDDYVESKTSDSMDKVGSAGTIEILYNTDLPQGGLVTWNQEGNQGRLVTAIRGDGAVIWCFGDGKKMQFAEFGQMDFNAWTHIALAWDGKTVRTYRNGKLVSEAAQEVKPSIKGASMRLGWSIPLGEQGMGNDRFKGMLGDVKVYSQALPDELIAQHYMEDAR